MPAQTVSTTNHKIGLNFLGSNYMDAYLRYQDMAESYVTLAKEYKPALAAARACYIIAIENAIQI
jgi:hypothetical protein